MKIAKWILFCALIVCVNADAKNKAKTSDRDEISKCLRLKSKRAQTDCLASIYTPKASEWIFSDVTKSPINDAPSVRAILLSDTGDKMSIGCYEGQLYVNFDLGIYLSTLNEYFYPIIYRVDSEPAVDCTVNDLLDKCYKWNVSSDGRAAGIWGDPQEFIQEIKDAKKLTVRLSNHSGDQKTAIFSLRDVLPTFEKIKSLCGVDEPEKTEADEPAQTEEETTP